MSYNQQTIKLNKARAEVYVFDNGSEVREAHAMIHADNIGMTYKEQLDAVLDAYASLREDLLKGYVAVFKRYYLSDSANQAGMVLERETKECAVSVIEQPPLDGTKIAIWVYMMTGVETRISESGLYEVKQGKYRHLWNGSAYNMAASSEYQTHHLLEEYIEQLEKEGCTLEKNCIRTWFFVANVDLNYGGVVRARNHVFFHQGLTNQTHFIASTGIGGRQADPNVLVQLDNYAVDGISKEQIKYLYAPTHLNRTSDYGVSFERGTYVDYEDRRHVFISGTASIDNKGMVVHTGDIVRQTERMLENIQVLLAEAECTWDNVSEMSVYLRDVADYDIVSKMFAERFPNKPYVIVLAPVCRPGWLIETECMAIAPHPSCGHPLP